MMHGGRSTRLIEGILLVALVVGAINGYVIGVSYHPITTIPILDGVLMAVLVGMTSVALLLFGLLVAAVLVEALFQGILFVGERMVRQ